MGLLSWGCVALAACSVSGMMNIIFVFNLGPFLIIYPLQCPRSHPHLLHHSLPGFSQVPPHLTKTLSHLRLICGTCPERYMYLNLCKLYATWVPGPSRCLVYLLNWVWTMLWCSTVPTLLAHYSLAFSTLFNQTQAINLAWKELPHWPAHWFFYLFVGEQRNISKI